MTVAGVKLILGGARTGKSGYALEPVKAREDSVSWIATAWHSQRGLLRLPAALLLKPTLAWRVLFDEVVARETALAQPLAAGRSHVARLASREGGKAAEPADTKRALAWAAGGVGCTGNGLWRHRIGGGWLWK